VDQVSELENALGAELLRSTLLRAAKPKLGSRYIVEDVLGRGASGLVVAALDDRLNRPVALKVRPVEGDSAMLAEARALARLDHPNVVRVHDVEVVTTQLDGREFKLWLVSMARLEGRTMRAWLREQQRTVPEILAVLIDVGRGLAAAHAQRISHRDVKPDNIMVRPDGAAQVVDFGLAVQSASTQAELGGLRPAAGTDAYIAPEARVGHGSRKSDQFSLGVTLVEALTGTPLPAGRRAPSTVPAAVWSIAQQATSPDPDDRFTEMTALVNALVRASRTRSDARSWPLAVGLAALALTAVAVMAASHWPVIGVGSAAGESDAGLEAMTDATVNDAILDVGQQYETDPPVVAEATQSLDAATAPVAETRACPVPTDGPRTFLAVRTRGGSPSAASRGTYRLGLEVRGREVRAVSLRRTAPARDTLEVLHFSFTNDCMLNITARADARDYEFWLTIAGATVTGRFEATHDPDQPDFGGNVEPAP
jgi:hypothetical protein